MKKTLSLLGLAGALLLSAAAVLAQDGFYVIAGGGGVGAKITSLPYEIKTPGLYYLGGNLTATRDNGITIKSDNVTLDLMGFSLDGPGGSSALTGIDIQSNCKNVEIRNGSLQGFGNGINADGTTMGIRTIGVRVKSVGGHGITLAGTDNLVKGCSVMAATQHGIRAGEGSIVEKNHVAGNSLGSLSYNGIVTGQGCTIKDNVSKSNGGHGIATQGACTIQNNSVLSNGWHGIFSGDYSTIIGNTSRGNTQDGICAGSYCTVTNNSTQRLSYVSTSNVVNNTVSP